MLSTWQIPRLKSPRTLHPTALTFSATPTKWPAKTWMPKARNLPAVTLNNCNWTTGPNNLPGISTMSASQMFDWDLVSLAGVYSVKDPIPHIPLELAFNAIKLMKCSNSTGTTLRVAEMLKASAVERGQQIRDLIEHIIHFGKIPNEWEESIIVSPSKGKGVAPGWGNYRGLKLLDPVMNVLERVAENFLRQQPQLGFMPGCSTTDT